MNEDIMLSIICPTYNHEKYIRKALDSVLMQKINFPIEVLVGEDCSTDNTRTILKEYELQHPGALTVFYRESNMFRKEITNFKDLYSRCKGKYIITLECDDFWIDENKLQMQVDFLETHNDYIAVAHNCMVVDDDSNPNGELFPECKDEEYTLSHYLSGIMPGQTTTIMRRNYFRDNLLDTSFIDERIPPGDRRMIFSLISNGKVFCIQKPMSAYRHVISGGSSYSANFKRNYETIRLWYSKQLDYAYKIGKENAIICAELLYVMELRAGVSRKDITLGSFFSYFKEIKHKLRTLFLLFKRDFLKYVLHKQMHI